MLCEPSGYAWNFFIYWGKLDPISGFGHAETVVLKLMEKLLDFGRVLYVDNFCTSVPLAEELLKRKTLLWGRIESTCQKGQHYLDYIPPTATKQKPTRKCIVCDQNGKRKESCYYCETGTMCGPMFQNFPQPIARRNKWQLNFPHIYHFMKMNKLFN